MNNIESCEVLKYLLKINKYAHEIAHSFRNDNYGLNSSCLVGYDEKYESSMEKVQIDDEYSTTYLPEYVEMVGRTSRNIKEVWLNKMRLSGSSLNKVVGRSLNSIKLINLCIFTIIQTITILMMGE